MKTKVTLDECIELASNFAEDWQYKLKKAINPANRRSAQKATVFWESVKEHLEDHKKNLEDQTADRDTRQEAINTRFELNI